MVVLIAGYLLVLCKGCDRLIDIKASKSLIDSGGKYE